MLSTYTSTCCARATEKVLNSGSVYVLRYRREVEAHAEIVADLAIDCYQARSKC